MKSSNQYNFLIADDHSVVRQGISLIFKDLFLNAEVFKAGSFKDIFKILSEVYVDLLVLDVHFPDGNSLNILAEIKAIQPDIKILVFSACDENIYAMRYLNNGASGYLNKGSSEDEMKFAINTMISSGQYISQNIKERILDSFISKTIVNPLDILSNQEIEVARLLIKGYGNLEILELLKSKKDIITVNSYKNRIFEKLGIDNLPDLINLFQLYFEEKI
nr:response regulator transcription factor [uncultured Flavobacterium sp.]